MAKIAKNLEAIARRVRRTKREADRTTPRSHLALEIAVLSERLDGLRELHTGQLRGLLREECKIDTDLIRLESHKPRVFQYRAKIRDNLKNRLFHLEKDRRLLKGNQEKEIADLQDRLFKLLRQHSTLGGTGP